jgi:parallel beta-helix repeat protein
LYKGGKWLNRKGLAVVLLLLLIGTSVIPITAHDIEKTTQPTSRGKWLYVGGSGPGNYTRIQDAINAAYDGDTVFVYDDSSPYHESLIINRSITLIGETRDTTVIYGSSIRMQLIHILAPHVVVQELTLLIDRDGLGIIIESDYATITGTIIKGMGRAAKETAVYIEGANHINISDNVFINVSAGVDFYYYPMSPNWGYNSIYNNFIRYTMFYGIHIAGRYNIVRGNDIAPADTTVDGMYEEGIYISEGGFNNISFNTVSSLTEGIVVVNSYKNILYRNTLIGNQEYGVLLSDSCGDAVLENNFIENARDARIIFSVLISIYVHALSGLPLMLVPSYWDGNYWDGPRSRPYPITGHLMFGFIIPIELEFFFNRFHKSYINDITNYVRFDRNPAQEPYDIPEMRR